MIDRNCFFVFLQAGIRLPDITGSDHLDLAIGQPVNRLAVMPVGVFAVRAEGGTIMVAVPAIEACRRADGGQSVFPVTCTQDTRFLGVAAVIRPT